LIFFNFKFIITKVEFDTFFSLHSGQILSSRIVIKGASTLVKDNKLCFSLNH